MSKFKATIGLEIHAELKTMTKMFCSCKNDTEEKRPNINICPICTGQPGTLPVINKEAVKSIIKIGMAIGGKIANLTEFDRKNYFYPDIPKGYQISQYKNPLVLGGNLAGVSITRIHLEEDTAKSYHDSSGFSLVDFNRAGVPLMELVTEPVMHSGAEVSNFGKELRLLLTYLGISSANMERGEMRLEANVSVSDTEKLGTKVEIKNLNSFSSAERGVEYEIKRQIKLIESGSKIIQETRGWNEDKGETFSQRTKEDSHDYRYFPDPDLPKLSISEIDDFSSEKLYSEIGEIPSQKRARFKKVYDIKDADIEFYIYNRELADLFEGASNYLKNRTTESFQTLSNYIVSDISGITVGKATIKQQYLAEVIDMLLEKELSSRGAKDIIAFLILEDKNPRIIAEEKGLLQKNDEDYIESLVQDIIENNQNVVLEYKSGKEASLQYLIGQGMKLSGGSVNPEMLKSLLIKNMLK